MDGTLENVGNRWRLRFTRHLAHAPDKVWRAITETDHLQTWFPQRIVGEWSVGAPLKFVSDYGDFDGAVLAYDPPRMLEFMWGTDTIRLEIAPDNQGTVLTLLDTFDEQGKAARDAAGWHVCLDALEAHLAGQTPSSAPGEDWRRAHNRYVASLGQEAATIGPPPTPAKQTG
jgi:uncharacterized protein YndB with AHSA1/START domain